MFMAELDWHLQYKNGWESRKGDKKYEEGDGEGNDK